jgi:hypothetical protein
MKIANIAPILTPITVGPLVDNAALLEQTLENQVDIEMSPLRVPSADRQVLVIHKDCNQGFF